MTLHLYDFDGTITTKDSFLKFIQFSKGYGSYLAGMLFMSRTLISMQLGLMKRGRAKERILDYFFGNYNKTQLDALALAFMIRRIPEIIRPEAIEQIQMAKVIGDEVAIVSASVDIWLAPFCKKYDLKLICTEANFVNGNFNGTFAAPNCNGEEKARRIRTIYNLDKFDKVIAYGYTKGDQAMFDLADEHHFKPFR